MRRTSDLKELSPEATKLKEKLRKQRENKLHGEDRSSGLLNGKFDYYGNEYQLPTEPEHKEYPRVYQGIWEPIKNTGLPKDSRRDRRKVTPVQQGRYYSRVSEDSRGKTYKEDYPTRTSSWRHRSAHRSFQRSRSRTRSRSPLRQHMSRPTRRYSSLQHPSPHRSSTHHKPHFPDYTEAIESKSKPLNYSDEIRLRSDNLSKRRDREKMNENIGHRTACSWEATQGPSNRPDVMNSTMNVDKEYDTNFVIVPELGKVNNDRLRLMMTEENQVVQRFHEHKGRKHYQSPNQSREAICGS